MESTPLPIDVEINTMDKCYNNKKKDLEFINIIMDKYMKVHSNKIKLMDMVYTNLQVGISIEEIGLKVLKMEQVYYY